MAHGSECYLPFSQREGLAPIPAQLKLGEVTHALRNLLEYAICESATPNGLPGPCGETWKAIARDLHVKLLGHNVSSAPETLQDALRIFKDICSGSDIGPLFDAIEFIVRHKACPDEVKRELTDAFVQARAAYRIVDDQYIVAIGTAEQANAYERAIADADRRNASGARRHLIDAGVKLRNGDWAGSVRDSIHAVESVAVGLAPGTTTLGPALEVIERKGHLHGGLKAAFRKLYGYSSDEKGVRHALVFGDAKVDEADALFMLGACASFVSYLLARGGGS